MQATMQIAQANVEPLARSQEQDGPAEPTLDQVFADHRELVFRAAYRMTGDASDAEDVLQTVFLRLARRAEVDLAPSPASYLHRAAINDLLSTPEAEFQEVARRIVTKNQDLYKRLA